MLIQEDYTIEENNYDIGYVINVVSKEAPKDERLAKQVLYAILSAKSNDPINLAINAPTGEGKSYVAQKVVDLFSKNDVVSFLGMSEKALFHRPGKLVTKDDNGNYIPIGDKIKDLESRIQTCDTEITNANNANYKNLKQVRTHEIKELEEEKKELHENSKKLIELNGMTLVFLDSPPARLLEALMPLLSHDRTEVEYEFVDDYNGIKTHGNVLRGFPSVIFTAAKDYTDNPRYPEIQRRFVITNPQMSPEKYHEAIHHITAKYSLPDYAYQQVVVSDEEKEKAKSIVFNLQKQIIDTCSSSLKRDHNEVFIPYYKSLESGLPSSDASYMSAAKTLFTWIALLATIRQRPKIKAMKSFLVQTIPLATFDDLIEAMSLIEHNNGVRPYIMKWFNEVFMSAYESKIQPDTKPGRHGETLSETRIAVTSRDLISKTDEIQKKRVSSKQILETYLTPLLNLNVISSEPSVLDGRAKIYYPVKSVNENKNLFDFATSNNISQHFNIRIEDPTLFPDEKYIMYEINRVMKYSSDERDKLVDHNGLERSVEEIVDCYYSNYNECFSTDSRSIVYHSTIRYDSLIIDHISREYYHNGQNAIQLQHKSSSYIENANNESKQSKYLFDCDKSNKILSLQDNCNAESRTKYSDFGNYIQSSTEENGATKDNNISQIRKAADTVASIKKNLTDQSQVSMTVTSETIDKLFWHDPNLPYRSPPPHTLEESPFRSIIKMDKNSDYYCVIHPDIKYSNLETVEHHIKFSPEMHKAEILKLLNISSSTS